AQSSIRMSALVQLEDDEGQSKLVFLGPVAGGLLLDFDKEKIMVITPASPLGRELIGKQCGDLIRLEGNAIREYEIVSVY
ncbi:MAG: GreA/GreB family elongation factor, partial [Deltaproteobacteria bacterium]|nr:GreA/GreB family elongation factor [Deltaproteobacteria bacterium]